MSPEPGRPARGPARGRCRWREGVGRQQGLGSAPGLEIPEEAVFGGRGRHRRALLELSALVSLAEAHAHGYSLLEKVDDLVGAEVCVDPGSVYRLLRGLEKEGYVSSAWEPAETGPSRRVYQITPAGRRLLGDLASFVERRAQAMQRLSDRAKRLAAAVECDEADH